MRIIILNDYGFINGGATQVAIASLNALAMHGFDVTFVSSVGPIAATIDRNLVNVINFNQHDLLSNPSRVKAAINGLWNFQTAMNFESLLKQYDPKDTIIHLHSWVKSLSSSVVHRAIKMGFKIVCTLHDYFSVCPNGGFYNYQLKKACALAPMSLACIANNCDARNYSQKLWRVTRQAIQSNVGGIPNEIKHFITVSDYSENLLRPFLPSTARFFRVRNPIEINKYPLPNAGNNEAFTFIGRLSTEKGGVLFAKAAKLTGVKAVFVGNGSEEKNIRDANPSAEILGWQNREGVIQAIRSSKAIVFPSLWHETQGLVVLEAAALGIPAIVSDTCAASEAIVDGESGLLFRAGDIHDLSTKLTLLHNNQKLATSFGSKAYNQYWNDPCTIDNHVKGLISCYTKIIGLMA